MSAVAPVTRLFAFALGLFVLPAFAGSWEVISGDVEETAIVFKLDDVRAQRLPAVIHERSLPPVFASQVILACIGLPSRAGGLVVYRPSTKRCAPLESLPRATRQDAMELAGGSAEAAQASPGQQVTSVIISPAPKFTAQALSCVCPPPPGNQAPVVSLQSGDAQARAPGEAIQPIVFAASDVDSPVLTERFVHRVNGGAALNGLPAGLSASCTPGSGTLDCSVTGTAPATLAQYQIQLFVSDGALEASAAAGLTVRAAPPVNDPPVVSVESGDGQERAPGEAITAIVFSAADPDSTTLAERFAYRVDGGPDTAGLPAGLVAGCTPGAGTLSCSVTGTAPAVAGVYSIEFFAADEETEVSAGAGLTVRAAPPVNDPPVVNVASGDGQERAPGEAIAAIVFTAADTDSTDLAQRFTYRVDGGPDNAGLPAGLAAGCTPGAGTLNCSVTGTAPANEGLYRISFFASDEDSEVSTEAGLTVRLRPPSVFKDGFEPQP